MTIESTKGGGWLRPVLDREGQTAFWDRQAASYASQDMTVDNKGELDIVTTLSAEYAENGWPIDDIVTFGGADGCRDPAVIVNALQAVDKKPQSIYFNDLSSAMTQAAYAGALKDYDENGIGVHLLPGPIHEVAEQVPAAPRRVIIGVYRLQALLSEEHKGETRPAGIDSYLRNGSTLGNSFCFEAVTLHSGKYGDFGVQANLNAYASQLKVQMVKRILETCVTDDALGAIRVVGQHNDLPGYFLSHWFVPRGIKEMIHSAFGPGRIASIRMFTCSKGVIFCIDPVETPRGIVTVLNNVIGNVLPHEQLSTLQAIDRLTS